MGDLGEVDAEAHRQAHAVHHDWEGGAVGLKGNAGVDGFQMAGYVDVYDAPLVEGAGYQLVD